MLLISYNMLLQKSSDL